MTPACAATHLPQTIYDYMNKSFFSYLCLKDLSSAVNENYDLQGNFTSFVAPMKNCQCSGLNYFGMPEIGFGLQVDQYTTKYSYLLQPHMYMTMPKVDPSLRVPKCALGLWNLKNHQDVDLSTIGSDIDQFAVGQNFIREYNMTFKYIKTQ